ncbi:MAG: hypothetical protein PVG06_10720 [Desulfobacterales bacterium]|jgi:hypothetical protein
MRNKSSLFIIFVATLAGFAGGFISNQIFQTNSAFAVKAPDHKKIVIAEEFRVVDKAGTVLGSFGTPDYLPHKSPEMDRSQASAPQLRLGQESGFQIILSANADTGARITMKDKKNKTRTVIGNTKFYIPHINATHRRQVSSIVLFDRGGRFLWSAPGGIRTEWDK